MSVKNAKKNEYIECPQCEYQFLVNAWGIPKKDPQYEGAIERAIIRFENITKECDETDRKTNKKG